MWGWRLEALGIGIERIQEEVKKYFPHATRFVFDGDSIKTPTHARRLITEFEKTNTEKGSGKYPGILIGTPMAIPHVSTVDHVAIVSIDSLFAIPDFRMNERIFALILALREKTIHTLLVQTRTDDTTLVEHALDGDLASFMHNEQALRKVFSYPPYGTIIKITLRGKKLEIPSEINRLKEFLSEYQPIAPNTMSRDTTKIFQRKTYAGEPKNMFRMYVILKLKEGLWVEEKLLAKLRALPPQFTVEVNPDHLL
jgi:primosomal protein N'